MGAQSLRNQYSDLFGSSQLPVLELLFRTELEQHPSRREALFNERSTDRDIWQYTEKHDLELFKSVPENSEFSFVTDKQGSDKTLTVEKFGLGFSISEGMVADAKFDAMADLTRKLAKSAKEKCIFKKVIEQNFNCVWVGFKQNILWDCNIKQNINLLYFI